MTVAPSGSRRPIVVIGSGAAGLLTALFLARRGHPVTVFDRDATTAAAQRAVPGDPDVEPRRATAQAAHSHIFLARLRELLATRAPDALDALRADGVRELPLRHGLAPSLIAELRNQSVAEVAEPLLGDPRLVALAGRRTTVEEALRAVVLAEPNVTTRAGVAVTGLVLDGPPVDGSPAVSGVQLGDGSRVDADLVIDASGRRTPVPGWLADAGVTIESEVSDCGIAYLSRFYRSHDPSTDPPLTRGFTAGNSFNGWSCLVFPADDGVFSVTFGVLPEDRELRGLADPAAFDQVVASIPSLAPWTAPGRAVAVSGVATMNGLKNRVRRYAPDGTPAVLGLVAVGDAAATSNPAHSRGFTLAAVHAASLADAVTDHRNDLVALASAADAIVDRELRPWVEDSIEQDAVRLARWRVDAPPAPPARPDRLSNGELFAAAQVDPVAWHRFSLMQNVLAMPDETLGDRALVAAVRGRRDRPAAAPAVVSPAPPTRTELVELIRRHAAPARRRGHVAHRRADVGATR